MKITPVNHKWRCTAGVYCISMCSRYADKESCPAFYIKLKKGEFTEDFVPHEKRTKKLSKRKDKNGSSR